MAFNRAIREFEAKKARQKKVRQRLVQNLKDMRRMTDEQVRVYNRNGLERMDFGLMEALDIIDEYYASFPEDNSMLPEEVEQKIDRIRKYIEARDRMDSFNFLCYYRSGRGVYDYIEKIRQKIFTRQLTQKEYRWFLSASGEEILDKYSKAKT